MEPTFLGPVSILTLGIICIYRYIIYPGLISPLAKIPNAHFLAPYTSLWILWTRLRKREIVTLHTTHKKYGSLLRLAPNELSISDYDDGVSVVYNNGPNWNKPAWVFNLFANYGIANMFTTRDSKAHSKRRRMINSIYSKSYLSASEDLRKLTKEIVFDKFLPIIHKATIEGTPLEMLDITRAFAIDYITAYIYGTGAGLDFLSDVAYRKYYFAMQELTKEYYVPVGEYATQIEWVEKKLGISVLPAAFSKAIDTIFESNLSLLGKAETLSGSNEASVASTKPITYSTLRASLEKSEAAGDNGKALGGPLRMVIASEMLDHTFAAYDGVGITLTYIVYEMSRDKELQTKLRSEVRGLSPRLDFPIENARELPDWRLLDKLPLLDAIVQETLRRWAPVGTGLFRTTPEKPTSLCGYDNIPGGVRVGAMPYILHRNEEVFPDAESWKPQRWLEASTQQRNTMNKWFWAFGSGPRGCIGIHFANMELRLVVAAIYSNYETSISRQGDMHQTDGFINSPKGAMLEVTFKHID